MNVPLSSATMLLISLGVLGGCAADHQEFRELETVVVNPEKTTTTKVVKSVVNANVAAKKSETAKTSAVGTNKANYQLNNKEVGKASGNQLMVKSSNIASPKVTKPQISDDDLDELFGQSSNVTNKTALSESERNKAETTAKSKALESTSNKVDVLKPYAYKDLGLKVGSGERYTDALTRWARERGYKLVAIELPIETVSKLDAKFTKSKTFSQSINVATSQVATEIQQPIYFHVNESKKLAAFTSWESPTTIALVHGSSFKDALKNLTNDYGWNWVGDSELGKSYKAMHNYGFTNAYPVATKKGDFASAIGKVISKYPVRASLHDGTQTVFIVDEK
ncbi:hypothetical protein SL034_004294 [Vibrio harveyi]|uniref:hypothetical protein n=1 Tax=Vibrio harveyi group TaxID=717610 RepID=UPI0009718ABA|nr:MULTISPECIES: hypothetical protein [Vibrio harveyi group]ELY1989206.1 hypothetical protein [Vibrio harveyi]APX10096.1 hypothetical protein BWP24_28315 [Vibrio campbellii]ARR10498.1 unknow [Vibrio campbellii]WCP78860.1 hypothetical protein PPW95_25500 [Vibrio parahaemolyticus]WHP52945.1 hypothetical protein QMY43_25345 [Vibrio parahaemolyticus]